MLQTKASRKQSTSL